LNRITKKREKKEEEETSSKNHINQKEKELSNRERVDLECCQASEKKKQKNP
jgi:hypothetical protein